jgi:ParB/RepB/Spo0J family partition protein
MILTAPAESFTDVREIPLDELVPFANNPRSDLGDLDGLAASIHAVGIIEPLVVAANGPHGYTVVAGHRRLAAARQAGLATAPCIHRGFGSTAEMIELAAIENLQREGLTPLDEARAMQQLVDLGKTQREIAERIGCNQSHVSRRLSLVKLPDAAAQLVANGKLHLRQAEELAALDEADIDDVGELVAKDAKVYERADGELPGWILTNAIAKVAEKRKEDKSRAGAVATGLPEVDSKDWGRFRREWVECKKAEATAWYWSYGNSGYRAKWIKPAPDAMGPLPPTGSQSRPISEKSAYQLQWEREQQITKERKALVERLVAEDPERLRPGLGLLVALLAAGEYIELGVEWRTMPEGVDDALTIAIATWHAVDNTGMPDEEGDADEMIRAAWYALASGEWVAVPVEHTADANEQFTMPDEIALDGEFILLAEESITFPVAPDAAEVQADLPPGSERGDGIAIHRPGPAEAIHDQIVWENPAWLQSGPWAGYRAAKVEALTAKIGKLGDVDKVRRVIAYEWGGKGEGLRRDDVLAAALARYEELQA